MKHKATDPPTIAFRPATQDDAELLLGWRNDPETRKSSLQQSEVARGEHEQWLGRSLNSPTRQIYVALYEGRAAGMVRFDQLDESSPIASEMSWSVAPEVRGRGFGKWMVKQATELRSETLVARIRRENEASRRIAEFAGFHLQSDEEGITWWRLDR